MDKINQLQRIIDNSNKIVFFGGAGVSTESGIPDFRSVDGLYNQKYKYPPEEILSHDFFFHKTRDFYDFYFDKMIIKNVLPNAAHYKLKELEDAKKLKSIVTQNIDGLHYMAGSRSVIELHGSVLRNYCVKCKKFYTLEELEKSVKGGIPYCSCAGIIKPDVVLYQEQLDNRAIEQSIKDIIEADTLIIAGTSLTVRPASDFVNFFQGKNLIVINRTAIHLKNVNLTINDSVGEVLSKIKVNC